MDDHDNNICPICWERFKSPKLLPCRHTFCVKCLQRFVKISNGNETLTCPMCRTLCVIPEGGVDRFMENYFVCNVENMKKKHIAECDMCQQRKCPDLKVCSHCGQNMCNTCAVSHKKVLKMAGSAMLKSDSMSGSESESEHETDVGSRLRCRRDSNNVFIPFLLQMSLAPIRCQNVVSLVSSFEVDILPDVSNRHFINCMCPISARECWVIPTAGPTILRYDITGKLLSVIPIYNDMVREIVHRQDGSLLIALIKSNRILKYVNGAVSIFTSTGKHHPYGITLFPDDRVAVVGTTSFPGEDAEEYGELQIYSKDGNLLKTIGGKKDKSLLAHPFSVLVNKFSDKIFVSDRGKNSLFIFSDGGNLLDKYDGGNRNSSSSLFKENSEFHPLSICADNHGNVIIIDGSSGALHLLDYGGKFIGLVLTNQPDNFGRPLSIATDPEGKIWLGDNDDKKVRIFKSGAFINNLENDKFLVPSLQFHPPDL